MRWSPLLPLVLLLLPLLLAVLALPLRICVCSGDNLAVMVVAEGLFLVAAIVLELNARGLVGCVMVKTIVGDDVACYYRD